MRVAGSGALRSPPGLRCGGRGPGPDKSGSSLAYTSGRTGSLRVAGNCAASGSRAGAGAGSRAGAGTGAGPDVGADAGGPCAAGPPEMNWLMRASTAGEPARAPSPFGGPSWVRCGGRVRDVPRCQGGGTSPCSAGASGPVGPGLGGRPPSTGPLLEPLAPPGLSPVRGGPGSFGELTYGSLAQGRPHSAVDMPTFRHYVASDSSAVPSISDSSTASSSALRATAISVSPSPRFIKRTPLVWRPALRT